ncbi:5'-methylthioadenosine/adenosylhomocysteine nucleosidase [Aerococcus christensenii]|uniref:5'-methylthioadenosine/adenosylhomocysteine nucleosidase n=1 Tax=Aerococcus christensenii TaxID=87541 RepID=UPI003F42ABB0
MKIAIIAALSREVNYYVETIPHLEKRQVAQVTLWTGTYAGHDLIIAQSGIGKVNAAMATTLVCELGPDLVINSGSAGALHPDLNVGDVVLGTETLYHDVDTRAVGNALGQMDGMPLSYLCDAYYLAAFKSVLQEKKAYQGVYQGQVVSGDSFISGEERQSWIQKHFDRALCTEMESTAIGQVAYQFHIPFLIVRAISDRADHQAAVSFETFIQEVGVKSAQTTLAFVEQVKEKSK